MEVRNLVQNRLIPLKIAKKVFLGLIIVLFFDFLLFPAPVLASQDNQKNPEDNLITIDTLTEPTITTITNTLPVNETLDTVKVGYFTITAYNSEVGQCDNTPCITANGFNLCEHGIEDSIATNILPFGTKIQIPELFGDKVFFVRDRMNTRYDNRLDVWMLDKQAAKKFGVKYAKVKILEP
jgi:3D (Asp-Asp-Asp) domain-containing protein